MESSADKQKYSAPAGLPKTLHGIFIGALAMVFAAELLLPKSFAGLDAGLLLLATLASFLAMNRQLPWQNILLAAAITALFGGVAHALSAIHGFAIPFGPIVFHDTAGWKIFNTVPWPLPFLWIVALFNSRGTARLILRPWRKIKSYGYWVIGLTTVLMVAFDFALEPFAVVVRNFWFWRHTKIPLEWCGASPLNFFGWAFVTLLILGFITPTLIKKQPGSRNPTEWSALAIWLGAILLFAVGAARISLWPAAGADAAIAAVVLLFAVRGARW